MYVICDISHTYDDIWSYVIWHVTYISCAHAMYVISMYVISHTYDLPISTHYPTLSSSTVNLFDISHTSRMPMTYMSSNYIYTVLYHHHLQWIYMIWIMYIEYAHHTPIILAQSYYHHLHWIYLREVWKVNRRWVDFSDTKRWCPLCGRISQNFSKAELAVSLFDNRVVVYSRCCGVYHIYTCRCIQAHVYRHTYTGASLRVSACSFSTML